MFVQDAWTLNRLTMNLGVRFERFDAQIKDQYVDGGPLRAGTHVQPGGRPAATGSTSRRGSACLYDLFGNARTALKATFGKYMAGQTHRVPARYNPLQLQNDTRTWRDPNGDNVAQDNEIGASNNASFGLPVFTHPARSGHQARVRHRVHRVGSSMRSSAGCR